MIKDLNKVSIVDLDTGNINSIINMLKKIGIDSKSYSDPNKAINSDILIIPGVGSFDYAMSKINKLGWDRVIQDHANRKGHILGICLGIQLLCQSSEEGKLEGLGLIPGEFKKFIQGEISIKIPHMGWNLVKYRNSFKNQINSKNVQDRFYFVHSYRYVHKTNSYIYAYTEYGEKFASIIGKKNIIGFQFHPEKSHVNGMNLLNSYFKSIII